MRRASRLARAVVDSAGEGRRALCWRCCALARRIVPAFFMTGTAKHVLPLHWRWILDDRLLLLASTLVPFWWCGWEASRQRPRMRHRPRLRAISGALYPVMRWVVAVRGPRRDHLFRADGLIVCCSGLDWE